MNIIWESKSFELGNIDRTYAILYSNGEIKFYDVDKKNKTIREYWQRKEHTDEIIVGRLLDAGYGEMVHISGNKMNMDTLFK